MANQEAEILKEVAGKTNSELILFFILLIVAMLIILLPLYRMIMKDRKERIKQEAESSDKRQDKYIEREREIIKVITANTEVMAGLKTTLEKSGTDTTAYVIRIHARIDTIGNDIGHIKSTVAHLSGEIKEIQDTANKMLLIVDSIPNTSNFSHQASN